MYREEHNNHWKANRQPDEPVSCNLFGYGELSQYDSRCCACWLGYRHTWEEHDRYVKAQSVREIPEPKQEEDQS